MDLNMPVKNGYQASEDIHALDLTGAANRIIAISADAFEEISQQCAKCGIGQHIAKPFTRELLLAAILDPLEQSTLKA